MNIAFKTSRLMLFQSCLLSFDIRTRDRTLKHQYALQDNAANKISYEREFSASQFILRITVKY